MNNENTICPFCHLDREILDQNEAAFAIFDKFPVSKGHVLIISKTHLADFFSLSEKEQIKCLSLLNTVRDTIQLKYQPDGFNIGINIGKAGGQTIDHVHIHLIPRYSNDVENPKGGVRGVIPSKKEY